MKKSKTFPSKYFLFSSALAVALLTPVVVEAEEGALQTDQSAKVLTPGDPGTSAKVSDQALAQLGEEALDLNQTASLVPSTGEGPAVSLEEFDVDPDLPIEGQDQTQSPKDVQIKSESPKEDRPISESPEPGKTVVATDADQAKTKTQIQLEEGVDRISGPNRYSNAAALSQAGWQTADTVILTSGEGDTLADSLTGTPLAHSLDAPLLLTRKDRLPEETLAEIQRLGAQRVIVLGGRNSVQDPVVRRLQDENFEVQRIGGINRYDQARLVAEQVRRPEEGPYEAFLVNGEAYADASVIAKTAAQRRLPIYLTRSDRLHDSVLAHIDRISHFNIIGGHRSISPELEADLQRRGITTRRFGGKNRYEVNQNVIKYYGNKETPLYVVSASHSTDALPAANLAAKTDREILLFNPVSHANVVDQVNFAIHDLESKTFTFVGGYRTLPKMSEYYFEHPEALIPQKGPYSDKYRRPMDGLEPLFKGPVMTKEMAGSTAVGLADPFIVKDPKTGRYYSFFEVLRKPNGGPNRDEIGYAFSDNLKDWTYGGLALPYDQVGHRSAYPYVFFDDVSENWYMIPDSSRHIQRLYKARRFPDDWVAVDHMLYDKTKQFVDANVFRYQGQIFMTVTDNKKNGVSLLYSPSNSIEGSDWVKHPQSFKLENITNHKSRRGGGRVYVDEAAGEIYLPMQYTVGRIYGEGTYLIRLRNLTLDQVTVDNLGLLTKAQGGSGWNARSMHHISYAPSLDDQSFIYLADGQYPNGEYALGLYKQRI